MLHDSLRVFLCANGARPVVCASLVRWCNGSTRVFGALCHGSNPCRTASFPKGNEHTEPTCRHFANITAQPVAGGKVMRFPIKVKYRGQVRATIYATRDGYRLYWRATVAGKRRSLTPLPRQGVGSKGKTCSASRINCIRVGNAFFTINNKRAAQFPEPLPTQP
jgi:hypothetical protein